MTDGAKPPPPPGAPDFEKEVQGAAEEGVRAARAAFKKLCDEKLEPNPIARAAVIIHKRYRAGEMDRDPGGFIQEGLLTFLNEMSKETSK